MGLALIGIALNDSGMVSGTGQGNLGLTVPLAVAGIIGAYLARAYYMRRSHTAGAQESEPSANPLVQGMPSVLLLLAVTAPMMFSPPLARSAIIGGIGAVMLLVGVRGHMQHMSRQPAR